MMYFNIAIVLLLIILIMIFLNCIQQIIKNKDQKTMYKHMYYVLCTWVKIKNYGLSIKNYLEENKIKTIAIYAAGEIGTRVYEELESTDIKIKYFTDKKIIYNNGYMEYKSIPIINIKKFDKKNDVDAIIVSTPFYMDSIVKMLRDSGFTKSIISLEQIVSELHNSIDEK